MHCTTQFLDELSAAVPWGAVNKYAPGYIRGSSFMLFWETLLISTITYVAIRTPYDLAFFTSEATLHGRACLKGGELGWDIFTDAVHFLDIILQVCVLGSVYHPGIVCKLIPHNIAKVSVLRGETSFHCVCAFEAHFIQERISILLNTVIHGSCTCGTHVILVFVLAESPPLMICVIHQSEGNVHCILYLVLGLSSQDATVIGFADSL